jgi:dihydroorotate dehydrogenase (NAD+) catalytic subunit
MDLDLTVQIGSLRLRNPVLVASGTFGYGREFSGVDDFSRLGGIVPKTVTAKPRLGNPPPRTIETPCGLLNSIGLDNDGIDHFLTNHLPYLKTLSTAIIGNVAAENEDEFVELTAKMAKADGVAGVELNLSCPNVSGGIDFATDPIVTGRIVRRCREASTVPLIAKLTPNVTNIVQIAKAAADGGADAVSVANTLLGLAVDWKHRRPTLGNGTGGLSGPAIKPVILRMVWQVARAKVLPIVAVGGIATIEDVMEMIVAGASAVQIGTANFYDPTVSVRIVDALPGALRQIGCSSVREAIGSMNA